MIEHGSDPSSAVAIKSGSNFHWGFEKKKEEKADKKKSKQSKKDDEFKKLKEEKKPEEEALATIESPPVKKEFILKNLDLTINQGEFVCIIGSIGSGKSSLLSTIIGDTIYSKESEVNKEDPTVS